MTLPVLIGRPQGQYEAASAGTDTVCLGLDGTRKASAQPALRRPAAARVHRPRLDERAGRGIWRTSRPETWTAKNSQEIMEPAAGYPMKNFIRL